MKRWGIAVLWLALVACNYPMEGWYTASYPVENQARNATQALLSILGGLRGFVAQMIWFKSDVYHHVIEEDQHTRSEMDPNIIAMDKFITVLDPHFVPAYDVGSFDLYLVHQWDDALSFVSEGITNNPDVEILWFDEAFYLYKLKRYEHGEQDALRALSLTKDPFEQVNCLRMIVANSIGNHDLATEATACQLWLDLRPGDPIPQARLDSITRKR